MGKEPRMRQRSRALPDTNNSSRKLGHSAHADDLAIVDFCEDVSIADLVDLMLAVLLNLVAEQSLPVEMVFLFGGQCDARDTDGAR